MWRNYSVLLAIVFLSISPAVADVVDVTFVGYVGGSGSILARCEGLGDPYCPNPAQGFDEEFLSFDDTNNNQDNFTASESVTADGKGDIIGLGSADHRRVAEQL